MKKVKKKSVKEQFCYKGRGNACGGGAYFLGFIGAAVYYISTASSFGAGVVGVLKALVWPAFLVYEALKFFAI